MNRRLVKYLVYLPGLPLFGLAFMFLLKSFTSGAHDGGFLGMAFGIILGQIIFTRWVTNLGWFAIPGGILVSIAAIYISYWIIAELQRIYNPIEDNGYYRSPNEALEHTLEWIFFIVLILSSIIFTELLHRMTRKRFAKSEAVE